MSAALKIPSIFTAVDKFSAPVRKMAASTQTFAVKAEAATARADRAFRRVTSPVRNLANSLGSLGLVVGGAAIVQGVRSAIGVFQNFEQANANLASVMVSATAPQLVALQEDAKRLGATTAKTATEVVGLQEAYARLGFGANDIINMTEATINGSVAMQGELAATAELAGAVVNTFGQFSSIDAPQILDQMTLATQTSALNFEKLQTALPIVGGAAEAAGIDFGQLLALLGKLSDAGIDASMSANALKNIFIESAGQGLNYTQILEKINKSSDKLTTSFDEFGKRPAVAGTILSAKLGEVAAQTELLNNEFKGTASKTAAKQLDTLGGAITILGSAYEGFILSLEDGNGKFAQQLRTIVVVATEMLSLASGTATASDKLDEQGKRIRRLAEIGLTVVKVIKWIVIIMATWKALIIASQIALGAYNIVLGITSALSGTASIAIGKNALALGAYKTVLAIVTAAQWLWNAAMTANPIGLIIVGVAALIALVAVVVTKWNEWGAALSLFMGPLGVVISMVMAFRKNWQMIVTAFSEGGILEGIKAIGKTLLEAILMPLQQLLEIASKLPGKLGTLAASGAARIDAFRSDLGTDGSATGQETAPVVSTAEARQEGLTKTLETTQKQNVNMTINNKANADVSVQSDNDIVPIKTTSTLSL